MKDNVITRARSTRFRHFGRIALASAVIAPLALLADDEAYQFIISGDPVAAAGAAASQYGTSDGGALAAGYLAVRESDGGYLYSTEYHGYYMIIK
ncbi:MAG: hypothetical protein IJG13_23530 [Kiritimatiellae bacterium]|nr:hypothetical protein [Kiritimatiellia bacterium]